MPNATKTKTLDTKRQYQKILSSLDRTAARMVSQGVMTTWPEAPLRLVLAYMHIEASLADASARMYCAALNWTLANDLSDAAFDAKALLYPEPGPDTIEHEEKIDALRRRNARLFPRGAQKKAKSLSATDRIALIDELMTNDSSAYAVSAAFWFMAGTLTGLRPCEWQNANLTECNKLNLLNAKVSNGRGFAEARTQDLNFLSESDIAIIRRHLDNIQKSITSGPGYRSFYNSCRDILRRTSDSVWPGRSRHPSLYTARHIFAADAKSSFPKEVVAALLGHGSIESASRHYAHSRTGSGNMMVQPLAEDVQAVRLRNGLNTQVSQDNGKSDS
jgi:hypothetical protein